MRRLLALTSMLSTLAGCGVYYGGYWVRPGSTEAGFEAASSKCESDAIARFPPVTLGQPGFFANHDTWCTPTAGGTNCQIISSGYLPQAQAATDSNGPARENAIHQCLLAGGWRPAGPDGSWAGLPEAAVTQALTYCESVYKPKSGAGGKAAFSANFDQCVMTRARELSGPHPPA
jgi:hypothetical protein